MPISQWNQLFLVLPTLEKKIVQLNRLIGTVTGLIPYNSTPRLLISLTYLPHTNTNVKHAGTFHKGQEKQAQNTVNGQ